MELKDTIMMMTSPNYKERFIAEYLQLYIRREKLNNFCGRIEAAELTGVEAPRHDCPLGLLKQQLKHMDDYMHDLEVRASIERINLRKAISEMPINTISGTRKPVASSEINITPNDGCINLCVAGSDTEEEQSLEEIKEDLKKAKKSKMEVE